MAMLVHVTGDGRDPLSPFGGHLVRNLERSRFDVEAVDGSVDAVVVSAASPADAVEVIGRIRDSGRTQPVVVVSDGGSGWTSLPLAFDGVLVVEEDVDELTDALHSGGVAAAPSPFEAPQDEDSESRVIDLRRSVPRGGGRGMLRERLGDSTRTIGETMRAFDQTLNRDGVAQSSASTVTPVRPLPPKQADPPAPEPVVDRRRPSRRGMREMTDPDVLVPALLEAADRLYGVRETGTAMAGHIKEAVGVDAVAVLAPDGAVWTVIGATGHRHLEERLVLARDHWLVQEVSVVTHGIVVEDTDIARSRLAGAPLAAWPHLLVCPIPAVHGIVVMARSDNGPAFTSRDLAHASESMAEAGTLLSSALQVRELARRLLTFAEVDDPGFG